MRWQERFYRAEDALRELRELGTDAITAMVVGRLADPSERREQALLTGLSVAEAFSDEGRDVLLVVDVPPAGLPELESLRTRLRAAVGPGSITLLVFDLVLPSTGFESPEVVPGDWDAYIAFDLQLARRGLFPAIDPLASTSRLLRDGLVDPHGTGLRDIWGLSDPTTMALLSLGVVALFAVGLTLLSVRTFTRAAVR